VDFSDTLYRPFSLRGYLKSCREIVLATRKIANAITDDIPELYVLGSPPASVVAFASKHPKVDALEVGDAMSKKGWHLNALNEPKSVHIACTVRINESLFVIVFTVPFFLAPYSFGCGSIYC